MQSYQTVKNQAEALIVEKKSRFIGAVSHVETEEDALVFLQSIRKKNPQANHNVYAYILRRGNLMRYSDDGEPQKTAGLPILEVLKGYPLTDTIVVVTRYFGGTLLGTGGLVRAYTSAAQAVLQVSEVATVNPCVKLSLTLPYALRDSSVTLIEQAGGKEMSIQYHADVSIEWTMLAGSEENLVAALQELTRGGEIQKSDIFYAPI